MVFKRGAVHVCEVDGGSLRRLVLHQIAARVHPNGFSGIDTPSLITGGVTSDGGSLAGKTGPFLYKNEAAVVPAKECR